MSQLTFPKKTISHVPLEGKTVLLRADYNVPLTDDGKISDDYRILQSLPTLQFLIEKKCKIVICAHLGRPDGKEDPAYTLEPVAVRLRKLLKVPVEFVPACIGDKVSVATKKLHPGHVVLLENLRYHNEEEENSHEFAMKLAKDTHADYFVQDGFGVIHRAHASTSAITQFLPSVAGLLLEREYKAIKGAIQAPKRPLVAVLGGAKIADKIEVIERFVDIADTIVVGGAMANTFLQYHGVNVGASKVDSDQNEVLDRIYAAAEKKLGGTRAIDDFIVLPVDAAVATDPKDESARRITVSVDEVKADEMILDIGPATIEMFDKALSAAHTVVWNGTMGIASMRQYSYGSARIALQLAQQKDHTTSVIGGGDTADFVLGWDMQKGASFSHVSTGGGASLELMAGKAMPGIDSLLDA